jgi:hypothetical protein
MIHLKVRYGHFPEERVDVQLKPCRWEGKSSCKQDGWRYTSERTRFDRFLTNIPLRKYIWGYEGGVEDIAHWWASWFVPLIACYSGDKIEMNKMGGACGTYGTDWSCMQLMEKPEWGRLLGRLRCVLEDVNWIDLPEKMQKWRAVLNTVMSLRVL